MSIAPSDHFAPVAPIPWERFTAEILALYREPMRAPATLSRLRFVLNALTALGVQTTAELTPELVAKFIGSLPADQSGNTTYSQVAYMRVACNYSASMGYSRVSPFAIRKHWVRKPPPTPGRKRHHSRAAVAAVLALARDEASRKAGWARWRSHRLYALVATVAYTGLRRNEALMLRREDIDLAERMVWVRPRVGNRLKTSASEAPVPMPSALIDILAEWLPNLALPANRGNVRGPRPRNNPGSVMDDQWVFPNAYRSGPWVGGSHRVGRPVEMMQRLGERAGVEGVTFQALRHSWATNAEFLGLSPLMIQRVLRHTTLRTQQYYRHADVPNMREAVERFGFGGEPPPPAPPPPAEPPK
jgi:integrase